MTNNLLPCPFCGGEAGDHDYGQEYWVKCQGCGVLSAQTTDRATSDAMWNRRAAPVVERQEPFAWFTDDYLTDKSSTTYDELTSNRWKDKGWPVQPLYNSPPAQVLVALPKRMTFEGNEPEPISISYDVAAGWNACLDKVKELNQ